MTHFTVLVQAQDEMELAARLAPYQENNCGECDPQYMIFYDQTQEHYDDYIARSQVKLGQFMTDYFWKKHPELADYRNKRIGEVSFILFMRLFGGCVEARPGRFGYYENPNSRWDYWSKFKPGWLLYTNDPLSANKLKSGAIRAGTVDWSAVQALKANRARKVYEVWEKLKQAGAFDDSRSFDWELAEDLLPGVDEDTIFSAAWLNRTLTQTPMDSAQYAASLATDPPAWAFVDGSGQWFEEGFIGSILKGGLGFGSHIPTEGYNYRQAFWDFLKNLPPDAGLYFVDCHV